jgi:hypothetical protein
MFFMYEPDFCKVFWDSGYGRDNVKSSGPPKFSTFTSMWVLPAEST